MTSRRQRRSDAAPACGGRDRGSVTAELAAALPALMVFTAGARGAVDAVTQKLKCVDAARDAALVAARGGDGEAAGRSRAPSGAHVSIIRDGDMVRAAVTLTIHPLGSHGPGFEVSGTAVAAIEPGYGA